MTATQHAIAARPETRAGSASRPARGRGAWPLLAVLVAVGLAHAIGMLRYPYLEADEGTYFSQGWAVFHLGRLTPYTYFYDHAPVGWIQIGLWEVLASPLRFASALDTGRVFMLVLQLGSTALVYDIGRRVTGRRWIGAVAALAFGFSAYGIYYHRRILLDNVAAFWLLVGLWALSRRPRLRQVWLSAIAVAVAVLSKEVAIAVIPAMAVLVYRQVQPRQRAFAVVGWLAIAGGAVTVYPLMALLKGELFSAGTFLGGSDPHVSLLCSLKWQSSRAPDGGVLDGSSAFWSSVQTWAHAEPLLVIGGTAAAIAAIVLFRRHVFFSMLAWTVLSLWLFLGRGGVVLVIYLVPLLPLLALCVALLLDRLTSGRSRRTAVAVGVVVLAAGAATAFLGFERSPGQPWTGHEADAQTAAVRWIRDHLPPHSRIVIDMSAWQDLHHPPSGEPAFGKAEYYWKAGQDPAVRRRTFDNSWRSVDFIIATPQLVKDTHDNVFPVVARALDRSRAIKVFDTGGWRVQIRKVDPRLPAHHLDTPTKSAALPDCMTYGT